MLLLEGTGALGLAPNSAQGREGYKLPEHAVPFGCVYNAPEGKLLCDGSQSMQGGPWLSCQMTEL